ncbi:MAG: carboxylesterase family protein, partial [Clostridiales bacterium]|nr:carboxylesterase family protein [Clostridiales bacterium]
QMLGAWVNFARYGNPNLPALPNWPACEEDDEATMVFDEKTHLSVNYDHELQTVFATEMGPKFTGLMSGQIQH